MVVRHDRAAGLLWVLGADGRVDVVCDACLGNCGQCGMTGRTTRSGASMGALVLGLTGAIRIEVVARRS